MKEPKPLKEAQEYLLNGQKLLAQRNYDGAVEEFQKVLSLSPQSPLEDEALFNIGLVYAHFGNAKKNYEKSINLFLRILNDYPESQLVEQAKIWIGILLENMETAKNLEKSKEVIKEKEEKKEAIKEPEKTKQQEPRTEEYSESREHLTRSQRLLALGNYEGAAAENQKILSLSDSKSSKDEALFNLGLIYAHSGNPQRDLEKSLDFFKRLIKNYPKSPLVEQAKILVGTLEENQELNKVINKLKQVDIEIEQMKRKKTP
jgi:tetratricopeptide (TPR) repeat protein